MGKRLLPLSPTGAEVLASYAADPANVRDAEVAIEVAAYGHYQNLAQRIRRGAVLTVPERNLVANILEGRHRPGRPTSLLKRGQATKIALFVARRELELGRGQTETAVHEAMKLFGVKRSKVREAISEAKLRFPHFGANRSKRKAEQASPKK